MDSNILCACGCGQPAPIAKENYAKRGWIKGQQLKFINGHNRKRWPTVVCKDCAEQGKRCKACNARQSRCRLYGLTHEQHDEIRAAHDDCAVCGVTLEYSTNKGQNAAHFDHDHKTGEIRGVLCGRCNRGLGMFDDDPTKLQAAIRYLGETHDNNL